MKKVRAFIISTEWIDVEFHFPVVHLIMLQFTNLLSSKRVKNPSMGKIKIHLVIFISAITVKREISCFDILRYLSNLIDFSYVIMCQARSGRISLYLSL